MNQLLEFLSRSVRWDSGQTSEATATAETSSIGTGSLGDKHSADDSEGVEEVDEGEAPPDSLGLAPQAQLQLHPSPRQTAPPHTPKNGQEEPVKVEVLPSMDAGGQVHATQGPEYASTTTAAPGPRRQGSSLSGLGIPGPPFPASSTQTPLWTESCVFLQPAGILRGFLSLTPGPTPTLWYSSTLHTPATGAHQPAVYQKAGFIKKRSTSLRTYSSYWLVLKDGTLNFYDSPANIYYPLEGIPVRNILTVTRSRNRQYGFKIVTTTKRKYHFQADTAMSMEEWVATLLANVQQVRNTELIIQLPLSFVSHVDVVSFGQLTDCLHVTVVYEQVERDYFFAYLKDVWGILDSLLRVQEEEEAAAATVASSGATPGESSSLQASVRAAPSGSWTVASDCTALASATLPAPQLYVMAADGTSSPHPTFQNMSSSQAGMLEKSRKSLPHVRSQSGRLSRSPSCFVGERLSAAFGIPAPNLSSGRGGSAEHGTSPPSSPPPGASVAAAANLATTTSTSTSWIWGHRKAASVSSSRPSLEALSPTAAPLPPGPPSLTRDDTYREKFFLGDTEMLIASFPCYFLKYIPRMGKLYLSSTSLCFKSRIVGVQTLVVVPLSDILYLDAKPQSSILYHGLMLLTGAQEEMWFEFYSAQSQREFVMALERQIEIVQGQHLRAHEGRSGAALPFELVSVDDMHQSDRRFRTASEVSLEAAAASAAAAATSMSIAATTATTTAAGTNITVTLPSTGGDPPTAISPEPPLPPEAKLDATGQEALLSLPMGVQGLSLPAFSPLPRVPTISPLVMPVDGYLAQRGGALAITCLTIGTRGDVQPYIALCQGLMKDGHRCIIATHSEYERWITGYGIGFRELKGNPTELMALCVDNGLFTVSFFKESIGKFRGWIEELLLSCWTASQGADLLIESPTAMGGLHCAEALGIPYFGAFPMPWTRTRQYPHPFAVPERNFGSGYNYMTHVLIEQLFWKGISGQVNRFRKKVLKRPPITLGNLGEHKIPFLYSFSPKVVPPPPDWYDWIHTCGYWFLNNSEHNWSPPASLVAFLQAGEKPVYIGFGSIIVQDPEEMTRVVVEACVKANVRCILSKGWSARLVHPEPGGGKGNSGTNTGSMGASTTTDTATSVAAPIAPPLPPSIYLLDNVPHHWLFPRMAGVVHHGGAGTTSEGLRAGVPTVIKPFFGDQAFWADRVVDLGVGMVLKKLTVDKLAAALLAITTDKRMAQAAKRLGAQIQAEDGVGVAKHNIYRDLDYALMRIKKLREGVDLAAQSSWLG